MPYSIPQSERKRRVKADRDSGATSQSDTVWLSASGRMATCYHERPDCIQAKSTTELRDCTRSEAQTWGNAPCKLCSPALTPAKSTDPDRSINNALKAADSFEDLHGGGE